MTRNRPRWLRIGSNAECAALSFLLLGVLIGCQRQNQYVEPPPPKVIVATAERQPVTIYHEYTGNTQASAVVTLEARVQGYLQKIEFADGVNVEENQLLFVIDPRPFQAALDQAKADLQSKQATVTQQESVYKRTLALLPSRAATQEQADIDRGNWLVAQANVVQSEANLRQAQLNLGVLRDPRALQRTNRPAPGRSRKPGDGQFDSARHDHEIRSDVRLLQRERNELS